MVKKILLFLTIIVCIGITGCEKGASYEDYKLLQNAEWEHYNSVTGEMEIISFSKKKEFSYHCVCGEPVGDSDVYDKYSYTKEGNIIIKSLSDKKTIDVLHIDEICLLIKMDGKVIEFFNSDKVKSRWEHGSLYYCDKCTEYIKGCSGYDSVVEISMDEIVLAPEDYGTDGKEYADFLRTVQLAEDVEFYKLDVDMVKDENDVFKSHDCTYEEISKESLADMNTKSGMEAFIWYNDNAQISKVVFYEETVK